MSYDPTLTTVMDRIRSIVGDTSNDPASEYFPDATYQAVIADYPVSWKLAAAEMAEKVAVQIEQDPTSYAETGDMSIGWGDKTRSLRAIALRLRQEAAAETVTVDNSIVSTQLERPDAWSAVEYRADYRHRRGRRW